MEDWKLDKIKGAINTLKKEEARKFSIVYSVLDEKYHGYLQAFPQKTKIWYEAIPSDILKDLQKTYGWNKVSTWNKGTFFEVTVPYLGVDGHLAILQDKHPDQKISISLEHFQIGPRIFVKAIVDTPDRHSEGIAETSFMKDQDGKYTKDKEGNPIPTGLEIATSNAIRKALGYTGEGRFPTHKTDFGESQDVQAYREYLLNKQKKKQ